MTPQIDHFGPRITTCQYVTKTYYLLHFSYFSGKPRAPKISPKSVNKNHCEAGPHKTRQFRLLESLRQEQKAKRLPKGCPKGGQRGPQTLKNDVPEGLEIQHACKGRPRWLRWPLGGPFLRPYGLDFWLILTSIFKVLAYCFPACVRLHFSKQMCQIH